MIKTLTKNDKKTNHPIVFKWAKNLNKQFLKKAIRIGNVYISMYLNRGNGN